MFSQHCSIGRDQPPKICFPCLEKKYFIISPRFPKTSVNLKLSVLCCMYGAETWLDESVQNNELMWRQICLTCLTSRSPGLNQSRLEAIAWCPSCPSPFTKGVFQAVGQGLATWCRVSKAGRQRCSEKWFLTGLEEVEGKGLIYSVCPFPWCKYSRRAWF